MTGRVALWFTTPAVVFSMHESGLVRVLGVSGETQPDGLNNVPTMKQAGYEMLDVESTYFFLAPAGTPPAIVERLNSEINNAQKDQPVLDKLKSQGVLPRGGTVDAAVQVIRTELASWAKVIKVIPER